MDVKRAGVISAVLYRAAAGFRALRHSAMLALEGE
jgi:hypothetical protein